MICSQSCQRLRSESVWTFVNFSKDIWDFQKNLSATNLEFLFLKILKNIHRKSEQFFLGHTINIYHMVIIYIYPPGNESISPSEWAFWRWFSELPQVGYVNSQGFDAFFSDNFLHLRRQLKCPELWSLKWWQLQVNLAAATQRWWIFRQKFPRESAIGPQFFVATSRQKNTKVRNLGWWIL